MNQHGTTHKLKIALISQNVSPGLLIFRKDFIRLLALQGHAVYCFALDYTAETRELVKALGATPVDYKLNKAGLNPLRDLRDTWVLSQKLKSLNLNVVFSFFVKPSMYGTLAAKIAGVPRRIAMLEGLGYIYTPTSQGFSFKKRLLQLIHGGLASLCYLFADKILFLNQDDRVDLAGKAILNQKKLQVIGPIGLDLTAYPYVPVNIHQPIRFIFIARLLAEKGIFEYLEAARWVKQRYPEAEFVVLGGLDLENPTALSSEQLQQVIAEGIIIYPGHVAAVPEWIAAAHVLVLPSYREGFPRAIQEAMAVGRAVITTDVPGCRETVVDGVNGFIVPPWNSLALAEKMLYLLQHPSEIKRMGEESYCIAESQFDVHKINRVLSKILTGDA